LKKDDESVFKKIEAGATLWSYPKQGRSLLMISKLGCIFLVPAYKTLHRTCTVTLLKVINSVSQKANVLITNCYFQPSLAKAETSSTLQRYAIPRFLGKI
jgi:hypothetical protein